MSSIDGSSTWTCGSAAPAPRPARCNLRYSSSVVAPIVCSSPREGGLEDVGGVDGGAGADERAVDEEDAAGLLDLVDDLLQPLLELAPILGAGDEGADIERDEALVLELIGDVAGDDPLHNPRRWRSCRRPVPRSAPVVVVRRDRICMTRSISVERPISGPSLLVRAASVRSTPRASMYGVLVFVWLPWL